MEAILWERVKCRMKDHYFPVIRTPENNYSGEYYPKAEADAVIARLEAEIKTLKDNLERCREMYLRDAV